MHGRIGSDAARQKFLRGFPGEKRPVGMRLAVRPLNCAVSSASYTRNVAGLLAEIDFLNSREKAVILWAVALVVFAAAKREGVASSLLGVLGALVHPKLLLLLGSAALYCSAVVLLAMRGGIWHTTAVKETVYWFVGSGLMLIGKATQASPHDPAYFKNLLRQA